MKGSKLNSKRNEFTTPPVAWCGVWLGRIMYILWGKVKKETGGVHACHNPGDVERTSDCSNRSRQAVRSVPHRLLPGGPTSFVYSFSPSLRSTVCANFYDYESVVQ